MSITPKEAREIFESSTIRDLVETALLRDPSLRASTPANAEKLMKFMEVNDMHPSALTTAFYNVMRVLLFIAEGRDDSTTN